MPPFNWPRRIEPKFVVPPAESRDLAAVEDEIEHIDRQLRALPPTSQWQLRMKVINDLLDKRNAIRPARPKPRPSVPVVPGRDGAS